MTTNFTKSAGSMSFVQMFFLIDDTAVVVQKVTAIHIVNISAEVIVNAVPGYLTRVDSDAKGKGGVCNINA
jgi:hypothetical protein